MVVCDRNKVVGSIIHGLASLEIKEKSTQIREPKDALYERAAELVVSKATVNRARSRASTTRVYGSDVHCNRALSGDTMVCK